MGMVLIYGIIVAIPAMIIAGPVFTRIAQKYVPKAFKITKHLDALGTVKEFKLEDTPSFGISILTSLMAVIFMVITTIITMVVNGGKQVYTGTIDQEEQLVNAHNILNSVTVPKMSSRSDTYTVYRSAVALETRTLYYENYSATGLFKLVLNDSLLEQSKEIFFKEDTSNFQTISLN